VASKITVTDLLFVIRYSLFVGLVFKGSCGCLILSLAARLRLFFILIAFYLVCFYEQINDDDDDDSVEMSCV